MMKRIIVTGGTGFLGRFVVDRFRREGMEVYPCDVNPSSGEPDVTFFRRVDVTSFEQVHDTFLEVRPDIVVHLAALAGAKGKGGGAESIKEPYSYFRVNVNGTLNVFEVARQLGIRNTIHMSSFSPYGVTRAAIDEDTPFNPNNPYGASKAAAEYVVKCYATLYNTRAAIFRAPLLCGEKQKEMNALREFVTCTKNEEPIIILGAGEHVREFVHPEDVADAFYRAIEFMQKKMTTPYEVFVLGGQPIKMKELAQMIIELTHSNGRIQFAPSAKQVFDQYSNTSKIRRVLGWEPRIAVREIAKRVVRDVYGTDSA